MKGLIVSAIVALVTSSIVIYQCRKSQHDNELTISQYSSNKTSVSNVAVNTNKQAVIDGMSSKDRVIYDRISNKLAAHGQDICGFNKESEKATMEAIHKADRQAKVSTPENIKQSNKAMQNSDERIRKKYGLTVDETSFIGILVGMTDICK